jgi:hypothetical protein
MILLWLSLGFLLGSLTEWLAHKHLLHNFDNASFSKSHFKIHHQNCRRHDGYDPDYASIIPRSIEHGWSEILMLIAAVIAVSPAAIISFWLWFSLLLHACIYYFVHRKSHLEPDWCKKWLPWHWEHHMGKNQNANWGVTTPIFDWAFGTRVNQHGNKIKW